MIMGLAMAQRRAQPPPEQSNPTTQRLRHSEGDYVIGSDRQRVLVTMRDSPFERAYLRQAITDAQYNIGCKYRHHWYHAGLCDPLHSVDPNRIFASDVSGFAGMAKSESQAFHRQQYRAAVQYLGAIASATLEDIICREHTIEDVGFRLGAESKTRAIELANKQMGRALCKLMQFWT